MQSIRLTLVCDGSSDRALIPVARWMAGALGSPLDIEVTLADLGRLREPPKRLDERIKKALELYPGDLLLVHRDAEGLSPANRIEEITTAVRQAGVAFPFVPVVPLRMTEAWLLHDEAALRSAAGNPNGGMPLNLPPIRDLETLPDPKRLLFAALRTASGVSGRRLANFKVHRARARLAERIDDYSPLRQLSSFQAFEDYFRRAVEQHLPSR